MRLPAQGHITRGFSAAHPAVDIDNDKGTPIVAPEAGTVTAVQQMGTGTLDAGLVVEIRAHSGNLHRLCHNDSASVSVGQRVTEGAQVARMGNTGYVIAGPGGDGTHCHWIMWVNGVRVDGRKYVTATTKEDDMPNEGDVHNAYLQANGRKATPAEVKVYTSKPWSALDGLYYGKVRVDFDNAKNQVPASYQPVAEQLYRKV